MHTDARAYVRANKILFVTLLLVAGMGVANAAWTPAPGNPTGGNVAQPLNVGGTAQFKTGDLGIGTTGNPAVGSALEIGGTAKGFLPPRMTTAQRNSLTNGLSAAQKTAARGLTIYNLSGPGLELFDGVSWVTTATSTPSGGGTAPGAGMSGPAFRAIKTGNQNLTNGQTTVLTWNAEDFDSDPVGTGVFSATTGRFKPSVAGQYLVSIKTAISQEPGLFEPPPVHSLRLYRIAGGVPVIEQESVFESTQFYYAGYGWYSDPFVNHTLSLDTIISVDQADITAGVEYDVRINTSNTGGLKTIKGGASGDNTVFSASRIGNPVNLTQTVTSTEPPVGAIVFFDTACPAGWTEYSALNGRYLVGATGGRAVGASATGGTNPLGDRAVRAAGAHTHAYDDYYYGGYATVAMTPTATHYGYVFAYHNQNSIYNPGVTYNKTTASTGAEETPAPYLQLRPCKRL